jgi:hypothetical protein
VESGFPSQDAERLKSSLHSREPARRRKTGPEAIVAAAWPLRWTAHAEFQLPTPLLEILFHFHLALHRALALFRLLHRTTFSNLLELQQPGLFICPQSQASPAPASIKRVLTFPAKGRPKG